MAAALPPSESGQSLPLPLPLADLADSSSSASLLRLEASAASSPSLHAPSPPPSAPAPSLGSPQQQYPPQPGHAGAHGGVPGDASMRQRLQQQQQRQQLEAQAAGAAPAAGAAGGAAAAAAGPGARNAGRVRRNNAPLRLPFGFVVTSRKEIAGCLLLTLGCIMVAGGLGSQGWITGSVREGNNRVTYHIGLLRTTREILDSVTGDRTRESYANKGAELRAGETALALGIVGLVAAVVSAYVSAMLSFGRMRHTIYLGHSISIWGAFSAGLSFIVCSIAYSAVVPKLTQPLTFGYSFILVLSTGFLVLIGGLIFVLSKQEGWREVHEPLLRPAPPPMPQ